MSTEAIELIHLTKTYGKHRGIEDVSFSVSEGEITAFLGPNGAGKTTTIRVLLGILRATSGEARLFGQNAWTHAVELHRRVAFVPGDVNLWDNLTGGEVIDFFLALRGAKPDKTRREAFLNRFELDPSRKCRTYSKGNRQKVALVAAFASDAELFILDEPTSGLDPLMEKVFQDCVLEIKRAGRGVLLSSHILSEVEKLADKVTIIREGRIVLNGSMAEINAQARGRTLEELFLSEYEGMR